MTRLLLRCSGPLWFRIMRWSWDWLTGRVAGSSALSKGWTLNEYRSIRKRGRKKEYGITKTDESAAVSLPPPPPPPPSSVWFFALATEVVEILWRGSPDTGISCEIGHHWSISQRIRLSTSCTFNRFSSCISTLVKRLLSHAFWHTYVAPISSHKF